MEGGNFPPAELDTDVTKSFSAPKGSALPFAEKESVEKKETRKERMPTLSVKETARGSLYPCCRKIDQKKAMPRG